MQVAELLQGITDEAQITAADVAAIVPEGVVYVVLDDDPTGTQSVADLPVLTRWSKDDLIWGFEQGKPAVYVLTNSRSLDPDTTRARTLEVVEAASQAAAALGKQASTLR